MSISCCLFLGGYSVVVVDVLFVCFPHCVWELVFVLVPTVLSSFTINSLSNKELVA